VHTGLRILCLLALFGFAHVKGIENRAKAVRPSPLRINFLKRRKALASIGSDWRTSTGRSPTGSRRIPLRPIEFRYQICGTLQRARLAAVDEVNNQSQNHPDKESGPCN
jgi:hypothetical protein